GDGCAAVVLLQQEHAGLVLGRPEVGVGLQCVGVDLVEDEAELVGQVVPAGVLGAGPGDQQQRVGVGDGRAGLVAGGVGADEPAVLGVGLGEVAAVAPGVGPHPAGQELVGLPGHRRVGRL